VILFLPRGIGSLWVRDRHGRGKAATAAAIMGEKEVAL